MGAQDVEATLDRLQHESAVRRAELLALTTELPEMRSRREVLSTMVRDVRAHLDVGDAVRRVGRRIGRIPDAVRRRLAR